MGKMLEDGKSVQEAAEWIVRTTEANPDSQVAKVARAYLSPARREREMRETLEKMVINCLTCGGEGTMYMHEDEASCGLTPGSSGRPCVDCAEARAALSKDQP